MTHPRDQFALTLAADLVKRFKQEHPHLAEHVYHATATRIKARYKQKAYWVYELRHRNNSATSARSPEKCIERFVILCATARLKGWQPPPPLFYDHTINVPRPKRPALDINNIRAGG